MHNVGDFYLKPPPGFSLDLGITRSNWSAV